MTHAETQTGAGGVGTTGATTTPSGWMAFSAALLIVAGLFNVIIGLVALFNGAYYVVGPNATLVFSLAGWGWLHLGIGVLAVIIGAALFTGTMWARIATVVIAGLSALAHLAFLGVFPIWSLIVIAIDVLVIWSVTVHGERIRLSQSQ
ncbi:DUF7144 family membrane protein [Amycolatopsis pigmentata]|uniref:DUF7144 domain-containing protein n=1 Tax=Amycolatopsis pigmentata TaxID=450801 RepID=A0ABW5FSI1_9PSEU